MRLPKLLSVLAVLYVSLPAVPVHAADQGVLIQVLDGGKYRVWHAEGETRLAEDELLQLEATAEPEGSPPLATAYGPARAYRTAEGVIVRLHLAPRDKALLLDHDACSAIKAWHAEGKTQLSEDELTDLVTTAKPEGGKSVAMQGGRRGKAFIARYGVMAVIWAAQAPRP